VPPQDNGSIKTSLPSIQNFPDKKFDIINMQFEDPFYDKLKFEINFCWRIGLFSSMLVLVMKIVENLAMGINKIYFAISRNDVRLSITTSCADDSKIGSVVGCSIDDYHIYCF
jgi:hypothetical protein